MKLLTALLLCAGCIDYAPDVGPLNPTNDGGMAIAPGCENADTDVNVRVSFARDVRPLLSRSPGGCGPCHLGRAVSGLDLSSYAGLRRGGTFTGTRNIVDSEPCSSLFLEKVGRTPPFGSRMPLNGPPYYTADELRLVHDWIAEGAANN